MRALDVIAVVNALYPNAYDAARKLRWLTTIEASLHRDIVSWHADAPDPPGTCTDETVLLADEPYATLYVDYLAAMMSMLDGEYERYTNAMVRHNAAYCAFANHYNRTHAPAKTRGVHF